ncbi:MAG: hypothetical protein ACI304_04000 [Lepagella sp.]
MTISTTIASDPNHTKKSEENGMLDSAIELSKEQRYEESFRTLNRLKIIAEHKENHEMLYRIHLNWGVNLAEMGAYDDALRSFFTAYKIAVDRLDSKHKAGVLNNIASVYLQMGNNRQANGYYKKNFLIAEEERDSVLIAGTAMNIAITSLNLGDRDECRKYIEISSPLVSEGSYEWYVYLLLRLTYLLSEQAHQEVIDIACKELKKSIPHDVRRNIRCKLASAYIANGEYVAAIDTIERALSIESDITDKISLYSLMQEAYHRSGNLERALQYSDSLMTAKDSLQARRNQNVYEINTIRLDLLQKEKEMMEIKSRERLNQILLISSVVIFLLLIWALINYVRHSKQKQRAARQELFLSRQNEELLKNQLQQNESEAQLKEKEHQLEIEKKNRELMSKAMSMANKNEMLQEIIDGLSADVKIERGSQLDTVIHRLKSQLNENKEWENFNIYFQQTNNEFIHKLRERHPELTGNEIRFISLIHIGLSNKEISSLLNITNEYCKKKRKSVALKMNLTSPRELTTYLSTIQKNN